MNPVTNAQLPAPDANYKLHSFHVFLFPFKIFPKAEVAGKPFDMEVFGAGLIKDDQREGQEYKLDEKGYEKEYY